MRWRSAVPSKFMPFRNVKAYVANRKYAQFADRMNWGGDDVGMKVEALIHEIFALLETCHMPAAIRELNIARSDFARELPNVVRAAYDDISIRSNPRMPLLAELEEVLWSAYDGGKRSAR